MFNFLVSLREGAWANKDRFEMPLERVGEYSCPEAESLLKQLGNPGTSDFQRAIELLQALVTVLAYETDARGTDAQVVRIGRIRELRVESLFVTFGFSEVRRGTRAQLDKYSEDMQLGPWEMTRTHWAVKSRDLPVGFIRELQHTRIYDVALSFASENRQYVEKVWSRLTALGLRVFFDQDEQIKLWGRDLVAEFSDIYGNLSHCVVMFISREYASK
ncbi:MAG: TIR domain-containing protein, partial [Nitrospirae bacterium]|nr:TIR domain-containing protein [Fimbriimonadaceae bacterium]